MWTGHTTYKSSKKLTEWDEIEGVKTLSQFERALEELGVEVIHAQSPRPRKNRAALRRVPGQARQGDAVTGHNDKRPSQRVS